MDPIIGGALIKAGGGLLGGLFGKKAPSPAQNIMSHMRGIRMGAEKYGFNPLAWAGTGATTAAPPPNYMGAAIADAFASVADAYSESAAENAEADKLRQENEELRNAAQKEAIRPTVPGLYSSVATAAPGTPWRSAYDAAETPEERSQRIELLYPERGETLETDKYGYPVFVEGGADDRPEEISTVKNETWYKKMNFWGQDLTVWNDEASDNEIASTAIVATLPWQYAYQIAKERWDRGFTNKDGTPQKMLPSWGSDFEGNHLVPKDWWKYQ